MPFLECIESKIYMMLVLFFYPVRSIDQSYGKDVPLRLGVIQKVLSAFLYVLKLQDQLQDHNTDDAQFNSFLTANNVAN